MVKDFPVADPLHLIEGGVMKKCMKMWMKESFAYKIKWTSNDMSTIDQAIYHCNKHLSSDINRQVRSLKYMSYFKATEFRTILLYTGMVIFKNSLPVDIYEHYLLFCLAVRLCSCRTYVKKKQLTNLARALFSKYCDLFVLIYGSNAVVSNIHNIIHIVDDVENIGPLSELSTYPFENFLREIKLRTQASRAPLEQITRRLVELSQNFNSKPIDLNMIQLERRAWYPQMKYETGVRSGLYKFIQVTPNIFFSTRKIGDSWFITIKKEIIKMKYAMRKGDSYFICGNEFTEKTNFFLKPYESSQTDIYMCTKKSGSDQFYALNEIKAKMICIPFENQFVIIPLLHSIDECSEYNI